MLSLDPATVGKQGYSHIFEIGESFEGNALIDHQHPHDFLMQAAAIWRQPLSKGVSLTLAGAPVGEPALGPIAFMHRSSAAENPMSTLGHHTFDSYAHRDGRDHRGPRSRSLPGRIVRLPRRGAGREPLGPHGSRRRSTRGRSAAGTGRRTAWTFQVSHGFLKEPDALEEGDVRRTTASAGWKRPRDSGVDLAHGGMGTQPEARRQLRCVPRGDDAHARQAALVFWRVEATQVETDVLRTGVHTVRGGRKNAHAHVVNAGDRDFVGAVSAGATRTVWRPQSWDVALGGMVTGYAVPARLSPFYGTTPFSFQVFLRVRPPAMHRMMDVIMTR